MAQQPKKLCYRTYPSPCSPVFAQRWVGWFGWYRFSLWPFGHWITVTGEEPPSAWLFQRKIYRSTFGSNFKNVLKPAIYPQQSRSANGGEPQFSGGTIALMAAHLGQRSSFYRV